MRWLREHGDEQARATMGPRFGIWADQAYGVAAPDLKRLAKALGRDHDLALRLWETGVHDARLLAAFVADPRRITAREMDAWCRDFDTWALCDGACFHLFDRTRFVFQKVRLWAKRQGEFQRRAAFALLAGAAVHRRELADAEFAEGVRIAERIAQVDARNFVAKGVSWALRNVGKRRAGLRGEVLAVAARLVRVEGDGVEAKAARWIGRDVARDVGRGGGRGGE